MNPKVHYRVHKSPSLDLNSSHLNPVQTLIPCFFKIQFNIIPNLSLGLQSCPLPKGF
jgi:hypothetical protein